MLFSLLKHYLELCTTDTALKVSRSFTVSPLQYLMVLKTFSPGCGVQASLMLFYSTALKGFRDIGLPAIFSPMVSRWAVGKSLSGLYLRNRDCRKLPLGRDFGWGGVGVQHHGVTLI